MFACEPVSSACPTRPLLPRSKIGGSRNFIPRREEGVPINYFPGAGADGLGVIERIGADGLGVTERTGAVTDGFNDLA